MSTYAPLCRCHDGGDEPTADGRCSRCWGRLDPERIAEVQDALRRIQTLEEQRLRLIAHQDDPGICSELTWIASELTAARRLLGGAV
jgi:hypothetical protein